MCCEHHREKNHLSLSSADHKFPPLPSLHSSCPRNISWIILFTPWPPTTGTHLGSRFAMMRSASSGGGGGEKEEAAEEDDGVGAGAAWSRAEEEEEVTESLVSSAATFCIVPFVDLPTAADAPSAPPTAPSPSPPPPTLTRVTFGADWEEPPPFAVTLLPVPICGCTGAGGCGITYEATVASSVGWNVGANFALEEGRQRDIQSVTFSCYKWGMFVCLSVFRRQERGRRWK